MSTKPSVPVSPTQAQTGSQPSTAKPPKGRQTDAQDSAALGLDELLSVTGPRIWIGLIALLVAVGGMLIWSLVGVIPQVVPGEGLLLRTGVQIITAPTDGSIQSMPVTENSAVKAGDVVATILDTQGATTELKAAQAGVVTGINVLPGFSVQQGADIMTIEDASLPLLAIIYVPLSSGKQASPGMAVQLSPSVADSDTYGYLMGTINAISEFPISQGTLAKDAYISDDGIANMLGGPEPVLRVIVELDTDDTPSGYSWSSSNGPNFQLRSGTATSARVIVDESHPINYFLPLNR